MPTGRQVVPASDGLEFAVTELGGAGAPTALRQLRGAGLAGS
jgi:hypothetical protein